MVGGWLRIVAVLAMLVACACTKTSSTAALPAARPPARGIGTAVLTWEPPRRKVDGSALDDLAGYEILYGTSPSDLNRVIKVKDPYLTRFTVDELTPGTYYFAVVAVTSAGVKSNPSAVLSKTIHSH